MQISLCPVKLQTELHTLRIVRCCRGQHALCKMFRTVFTEKSFTTSSKCLGMLSSEHQKFSLYLRSSIRHFSGTVVRILFCSQYISQTFRVFVFGDFCKSYHFKYVYENPYLKTVHKPQRFLTFPCLLFQLCVTDLLYC